MPMPQLSGLDATFLYLETPEMPMHVGAMHLLELPEGYRGRWRHPAAAVVCSAPARPAQLRRRLWWMPLNLANPVWVDAAPDLSHHIVEHRLPRPAAGSPGAMRARCWKKNLAAAPATARPQQAAVAHARHRRPRRAAPVGSSRWVYSQLHHAAVDGRAAVALGNVLFDLTPEPREIEIRPSGRPRPSRIGMVEMLRGALGNEASQVAHLVRRPGHTGHPGRHGPGALNSQNLLGQGSGNVTLARPRR